MEVSYVKKEKEAQAQHAVEKENSRRQQAEEKAQAAAQANQSLLTLQRAKIQCLTVGCTLRATVLCISCGFGFCSVHAAASGWSRSHSAADCLDGDDTDLSVLKLKRQRLLSNLQHKRKLRK